MLILPINFKETRSIYYYRLTDELYKYIIFFFNSGDPKSELGIDEI